MRKMETKVGISTERIYYRYSERHIVEKGERSNSRMRQSEMQSLRKQCLFLDLGEQREAVAPGVGGLDF